MRIVTLTAAGSAVAAAGMLALVVVVGARDLASGTGRSVSPSDTIQAVAVLGAVRGISPLACSLAANALENRWGQNHLGGADAALLDSVQSVARTWATSNDAIDDALPVLRRSLSDPDPCARRIAAELLARVENVGLATALRAELASAGAETREAAVLALGYAPRKSNEQALLIAATDRDVRVRRVAGWALGRTGDRAAVSPLSTLLRDDDPIVRVNAALALGSLATKEAVPALTNALAGDRDARVRRAAAAALGRIQ